MQRRGVAFDVALEGQPGAGGHDRHPVIGEKAGEEHRVSGVGQAGTELQPVGHHAHPGGGDEDLVRLAPGHDLGVAGDHRHPALARGRGNGIGEPFQVGQGKAFLQDQGQAQGEGGCALHGQVVDGPEHRELADIAAGKEDRVDHVAVGGEGEAAGRHGQHRAVLEAGEDRVVQAGQKDRLDQVPAGDPAAAVVQKNAFCAHRPPYLL